MSSTPDAPPNIRRVILASFVGTTIEWYDFFLYGTAAALVFNRLFFPTLNPLAGTMAAFGTYAQVPEASPHPRETRLPEGVVASATSAAT